MTTIVPGSTGDRLDHADAGRGRPGPVRRAGPALDQLELELDTVAPARLGQGQGAGEVATADARPGARDEPEPRRHVSAVRGAARSPGRSPRRDEEALLDDAELRVPTCIDRPVVPPEQRAALAVIRHLLGPVGVVLRPQDEPVRASDDLVDDLAEALLRLMDQDADGVREVDEPVPERQPPGGAASRGWRRARPRAHAPVPWR